jgi:hypothetical protein
LAHVLILVPVFAALAVEFDNDCLQPRRGKDARCPGERFALEAFDIEFNEVWSVALNIVIKPNHWTFEGRRQRIAVESDMIHGIEICGKSHDAGSGAESGGPYCYEITEAVQEDARERETESARKRCSVNCRS